MSKNDKKNSKAADAVNIVSKLRAFEATFKAACYKHDATPHKPLLLQLQQQQEDAEPLKKLLLNGAPVDGRCALAVAAALAGYPEVLRLGFWRCSLGDTGLEGLGQLLRASTARTWTGSKVQHLELIGDGQPDSQTPSLYMAAKAAAAAAAAAPPPKKAKAKKAAAAPAAAGTGEGAAAAAADGAAAAAADAASAGGSSDAAGSGSSGGASAAGGSSGGGESPHAGLTIANSSGGWGSTGGGSRSLYPPMTPSSTAITPRTTTAQAGSRRQVIPQALEFPLHLSLAQASLKSRASGPESMRRSIACLRTSLEVRRTDMKHTIDCWQGDQAAQGFVPISKLGVLESVVVAGVAVDNPLLTVGYKRYTPPTQQQQQGPQSTPQCAQQQQQQAAGDPGQTTLPQQQQQQQQQRKPQFSASALQAFARSLGCCGLQLASLVLDYTYLGDSALTYLGPGLQRCSSLKTLSLQYCGLGPAATTAISSVLLPTSTVNTGSYSVGYTTGNKQAAAAAAAAVAAAAAAAAAGSAGAGGGVSVPGQPSTSSGGAVPTLVLPKRLSSANSGGSRLANGSGDKGLDGHALGSGNPLLQSAILEDANEFSRTMAATGTSTIISSSSVGSRAPQLQVLVLSGNRLTGAGLSQLAPALRQAKALQVLGLADIGLVPGDIIGLQQLVNALGSGCPDLQQLDLDLNFTGDGGASLMLPLLASKPQLQLTKVNARVSRGLTCQLLEGMDANKPKKGKKGGNGKGKG